jgi:hypothetical protein
MTTPEHWQMGNALLVSNPLKELRLEKFASLKWQGTSMIYEYHQETDLKNCKVTGQGFKASELMTSGACVFTGPILDLKMSRLLIITRRGESE